MESWKRVWREGFAPVLSSAGLEALARALESDDPRLVQIVTTQPPPMPGLLNWPVEAACAVAYAGWRGDRLVTVAEVDDYFACVCREADRQLGCATACRLFLNAFDEWPREEMVRQLLPEVRRELRRRHDAERADEPTIVHAPESDAARYLP